MPVIYTDHNRPDVFVLEAQRKLEQRRIRQQEESTISDRDILLHPGRFAERWDIHILREAAIRRLREEQKEDNARKATTVNNWKYVDMPQSDESIARKIVASNIRQEKENTNDTKS